MNPPPAPTLFQHYLLPGERILWTGRPKQGLALRSVDALLIPFSLLWAGFALVWNVTVWTFPETGAEPDLSFKLFGLPFLVIGIYIVIGRFFHDAAIRKNLLYAVTNQRLFVLSGSRSRRFTSLDLHRLPMLELNEHGDGTGTIAFDTAGPSFTDYRHGGMDWWVPSLRATSQFFRVDNPRSVYQLIRDNAVST